MVLPYQSKTPQCSSLGVESLDELEEVWHDSVQTDLCRLMLTRSLASSHSCARRILLSPRTTIHRRLGNLRTNSTNAGDKAAGEADGKDIQRKLPKWMAKYSDRFKNNPASHVTSFLILHELTALLPLPLLFWLFHSFDWTPEGMPLYPFAGCGTK